MGVRPGAPVRDRCVPPDDEDGQRQLPSVGDPGHHDDEDGQRQLPSVGDPGHHEADQGEGRGGNRVRAHTGGRGDVLREPGGKRPGGVQACKPCDHREPVRRMPRRRAGQGLHARHLQKGLTTDNKINQ